jgi:ketosteroid isomerase-like protein
VNADEHIDAFNTAVRSGDWDAFADRFAADAVLVFVGPPVGPFAGRDAIASAYAAQPPDDTISIAGEVTVDGDETVVPYRWDATGATGTMRLSPSPEGLLARLVVTFD